METIRAITKDIILPGGPFISNETDINQAVRITKNGLRNSDGCRDEKPKEYHRIEPFPKSVPKIGNKARAVKLKIKPITPRRRKNFGDSIEKRNITVIANIPKIN
jgi:hypothetical protein